MEEFLFHGACEGYKPQVPKTRFYKMSQFRNVFLQMRKQKCCNAIVELQLKQSKFKRCVRAHFVAACRQQNTIHRETRQENPVSDRKERERGTWSET